MSHDRKGQTSQTTFVVLTRRRRVSHIEMIEPGVGQIGKEAPVVVTMSGDR
jgi:hypothetical protein